MWVIFSLLAGFFSALTSVLSSFASKKVDSLISTLLRVSLINIILLTILISLGLMSDMYNIDKKTFIFLILSGISTSLLWIYYFKALEEGSVNKVSPVDKLSIVLTLILSNIFLKEEITIIKAISMLLIVTGSLLTIKKDDKNAKSNKWLLYAILTGIFTSTTTILGKIGIKDIDPNIALFVRTIVAFIVLLIINIIKKNLKSIKKIDKKDFICILLTGVTTCISWICYYKALKDGNAADVFAIEKSSLLFAVLLSTIFLKDKLYKKTIIGLIIIIIGIVLLL